MMDSEKLNKLRIYYHSLLEQQRLLSSLDLKGGIYIDTSAVRPLVRELQAVSKEFPDTVPEFNVSEYVGTRGLINYVGIMTFTASAIGRIKVAIEQPTDTPVTEYREFGFISDSDLRVIIERDYSEIQRAFLTQCWKSVIILCGGTIEAIFTDQLKTRETEAKSSKLAPSESDITRWDLSQLINVAVDLQLVATGVEKLSHPLREYRNLVHPGYEVRKKLTFDAEEAKIAIQILNMVHRDFSK